MVFKSMAANLIHKKKIEFSAEKTFSAFLAAGLSESWLPYWNETNTGGLRKIYYAEHYCK